MIIGKSGKDQDKEEMKKDYQEGSYVRGHVR